MCLGIPGQVVALDADDPHRATAEVEGARREISIALFADGAEPPIERGEWVLIHVGFAMSRIDEAEANETLRSLRALGEVYEGEREEFAAASAMDPLVQFGGGAPRPSTPTGPEEAP